MSLDRRSLLIASLAALPLLSAARHPARAAEGIAALDLVEPLGRPSVVWTLFDLLRPVLADELGCPVTHETVPGEDGQAALRYLLDAPASGLRLWGSAVMATQFHEQVGNDAVRIGDLVPIAKLTDGFSVALFGRADDTGLEWLPLLQQSAREPQTLSCLQQATAAYVAKLMAEKQGGLKTVTTLRDTLPEVIADVVEGRARLGILPTALVAKQPNRLRPVITFGAARNTTLTSTPTFGEVMGNPKFAFTESIGVFGPPGLDSGLQGVLTKAFLDAGHSEALVAAAELSDFPVAVNDASVMAETMARNQRVLRRLLE